MCRLSSAKSQSQTFCLSGLLWGLALLDRLGEHGIALVQRCSQPWNPPLYTLALPQCSTLKKLQSFPNSGRGAWEEDPVQHLCSITQQWGIFFLSSLTAWVSPARDR